MNIHNGDHLQYELDNVDTPPEKRSDWPMASFDARDWAKAFCNQNPDFNYNLAVAWFACALMRGHDEGVARMRKQP